jgi:tetratricopeptide (TPR) repeat protein
LASKKDKLLESAQKFIAKGQFDRAIRDYEQIVALDSGDIRHRQKLAELLVRVNRKEDAVVEYEAISRQYSNNHFYLKAIAVYKQIQKLDPANIKTTLTLASLNEKQGLIGNALSEYNLAVNYYLKAGSLPEAINIIEQMLAADPENLNTHLKCAETYFTAGLRDKAYGEFTRLALLLRKRGDESAFSRVCERVKSLYPDKNDFPDGLLTTQVEEGQAVDAINFSPHVAEEVLKHEAEASPVSPEPSLPAEPPPVVAETQLPAEPPPAIPEAPLPAESPGPPQDMTWEEEIDLSLLEEEGMSFFQDDAGKEETALPAALESAEESLQRSGVDFSDLEIGGMEKADISEKEHPPESEPEETHGQDGPFTAGESPLESVDLSSINMQIEALRRTSGDWRPDIAQTEPIAAGTDEKVTEKEPPGIPPAKKKRKYDLDGQLNDFKRVLDDQVDKNDTETHYSLGIAYKEMCLFDDAVNEFQNASQDPQRRIDCLTLEGVCYRDKGDYAKAEEILNNTLSMQGLTGEEVVSLRYELAILFETVGRQKDALQLYQQVQSDDPGYRDAAKKIALLQGGDDAPDQDEADLLELDVEELD